MAGETAHADCGPQTRTPAFRAGDVVISCEPWIWSFKYEHHKLLCAECFRESQSLRVCSNCKLYRYCDKRCQGVNWKKEHNYECGMLKKIETKYHQTGRGADVDPNERNLKRQQVDTCASEILIAKAISKFKRGDEYKMSKSSGLSAAEVIDILPYDPAFEKTFKSTVTSNRVWDTDEIGDIPNLDALIRKILYNRFPIMDQQGKLDVIAAGIFPGAMHRQMTAVCWDTNVTMDLQGRTLVVRATQDILNYTGLNDLRQNELAGSGFLMTLDQRRAKFEHLYGHRCTCYKCTQNYDAEINPLKCLTSGCTERIPSDVRALRPCPQCGAINGNRLHQLMKLKEKYETLVASPITDDMHRLEEFISFFREVYRADILQPDAHFHFACGYGVLLTTKHNQKDYEETWEICCGMITCIRAVYPKYHLARAWWLMSGANVALAWFTQIVSQEDAHSMRKFKKICPEAAEWAKESRDIYATVSGKGSKWEQHAACVVGRFAELPFMISLVVHD